MKILKDRVETLYYELKDYVEAFEKKTKVSRETAFDGKPDNMELFDEDVILETAYNIFSNQNLHHSDIHGMEIRFTVTYENLKLLNPETKLDKDIDATYKLLTKKHLSNFYILDKEKEFAENSPERIEATKQTFKEAIMQNDNMDWITAQLEKELNN